MSNADSPYILLAWDGESPPQRPVRRGRLTRLALLSGVLATSANIAWWWLAPQVSIELTPLRWANRPAQVAEQAASGPNRPPSHEVLEPSASEIPRTDDGLGRRVDIERSLDQLTSRIVETLQLSSTDRRKLGQLRDSLPVAEFLASLLPWLNEQGYRTPDSIRIRVRGEQSRWRTFERWLADQTDSD